MYNCCVDQSQIQGRIRNIQVALKPLAKARQEIACCIAPGRFDGGRIIAAHGPNQMNYSHRDWRFRTFRSNVWCQYFEQWLPAEGERSYYLWKAYLRIESMNENGIFEELLCLHMDPNITLSDKLYQLKLGPHLHIKRLIEDFPSAHIPLNFNNLAAIIESEEALFSAFDSGLAIVKEEFLSRIK